MHLVAVTAPGPFELVPGQEYLMDDTAAATYLLHRHASATTHWQPPQQPDPNQEPTTKNQEPRSLLVIRAGGFGDILFLTPSLAELIRRHPDTKITLATLPPYRDAIQHPALAKLHLTSYPVLAPTLGQYDRIIPLEDLIENNPDEDATTLFANALGLLDSPPPHKQYRIDYLTPRTQAFIRHLYRWPTPPDQIQGPTHPTPRELTDFAEAVRAMLREQPKTNIPDWLLLHQVIHGPTLGISSIDSHVKDAFTWLAQLIRNHPPIQDRALNFKPLYTVPAPETLAAWRRFPPQPAEPQAFTYPPLTIPSSEPRLQPESSLSALSSSPTSKLRRARIGIQVEASARCRTYPLDKLQATIELLLQAGAQIFLFNRPETLRPGQVLPQHPQLVPLPALPDPPDFKESAAIITTLDLMIAPDSALCHLAGALDVPTIAIYGPFHWRQRTLHSPAIAPIQGHAPCAPCHHHVRHWNHWPDNQPCSAINRCLALDNIPPTRILKQTFKLLAPKLHQQTATV